MFDLQVNLSRVSGAPVALIAMGHGILMKVKKSREHRGENMLFSCLPESPPCHQRGLNVSGRWEHHSYLLQSGNQLFFETHTSANNSTLYYNVYGLSAASHLNSIVKCQT